MNVVDSSAWLEYFAGGPNADYFAKAIEDVGSLVVPSITIYEVFKKVLLEKGEESALQVAAQMKTGHLVEIEEDLAIDAARLSVAHKLPMADSLILATARSHDAWLWTQDDDFKGLDKVNYRAKK
ncbi:MAG TPA: type II toxin-antitoxin system VapC family toxin [Kiritimatiellia bacterium]|nr:type II toxin-antitoxin system VapC family toxin [Kiritimatiellia bacterium]